MTNHDKTVRFGRHPDMGSLDCDARMVNVGRSDNGRYQVKMVIL
jgi:hypothetical protein